MEHYSKIHKSSIRYAKISLKKRMQLVKQVIENNQLVSRAAKRLNLKLSTAKLIVKRFKQDGTYFEAKSERLKRMEKELSPVLRKQKIIQNTPAPQNSPQPQQIQQQTGAGSQGFPTMLYFPTYCGGPFTYGFPFFENMMFYPL